jgi:hypothetical protein
MSDISDVLHDAGALVATEWGVLDQAGVERIEGRSETRRVIKQTAGDTDSLLGTTSDGAGQLLYNVCKLSVALNAAQTMEDVRAATAHFAPMAQAFLDEVARGEVVLPFLLKGEEAVMADVKRRQTLVAQALIDARHDT